MVLDKAQYTQQVEEMLSDKDTYKTLENDPTSSNKRKLVTMLRKHNKDGKFSQKEYKEIYPTAEGIPRMYCTPKIHKNKIPAPLRPIVDCTGSVTYGTSKHLVAILRPLVGKTEQHCKNSAQLAQDLANVKVLSDEIIISHDVVALFTKTPVDATLKIVRARLEADKSLKKRTKLTVDDIMELLTFVTKATYFMFNGKIYKQLDGFAMGDPLSAVMSNLFMENLEQKAIPSAPIECRLSLWKRYVDDILEKIVVDTLPVLTAHLNSQDETGMIKFTDECEHERQLAFLDAKICVNDDGTIRLKIFRKATHTDQYLMFDSHHPLEHKLSVVRTLLSRKESIVTCEEDRVEEDKHIREALAKCKYPKWAIDKVQKELDDKKAGIQKPKPNTSAEESKKKGMCVLPYVAGTTERIRRIMNKYGVTAPARPHSTIRQCLVHPKDKLPDSQKCGVVYKVDCLSCNQCYIGETGRKLEVRIEEHRDEAEKVTSRRRTRGSLAEEDPTKFRSAITEHLRTQNHVMDWPNIEVVDRENNKRRRWIKESIHVRKRGITCNRDEGGYELSHVWDPLLRPATRHPKSS